MRRQRSSGPRRSAASGGRRRWCCTCSPRVAPEMTEETVGCAASPAMATSRTESPRSAAYASRASMRSQSALASQPARLGVEVGAGTGRGGLAAAVLAGEQAVLQREERQHAQAEALARRDQLALDVAVEQRVAVLRRHERARGPWSPRSTRRRRPASRRSWSSRGSAPCPRGPARSAHRASRRSGSPGRARAAGRGRCGRSAAGAGSPRPRAGCSGATRARRGPRRWRPACPCRTWWRRRTRRGDP